MRHRGSAHETGEKRLCEAAPLSASPALPTCPDQLSQH